MSTLRQLRENLAHTWENLTEGWRHLSERASGALTRFSTGHWNKETTTKDNAVAANSAQWGLMAAEIYDDEKSIYVNLEAPGMDIEDFDIQVYDDVLVIRGEKRVEHEEGKGDYYLLERAYGRFERAIPLPAEVDHDKAKAKYKRGLLRITLPKTEKQGNQRRIKVTE